MCFQIIVQKIRELVVFQSPLGCDANLLWCLRDKAFEYQILSVSLYVSGDKSDILVDAIDVEGIPFEFRCQSCASDDLHLMDFQDIDGE